MTRWMLATTVALAILAAAEPSAARRHHAPGAKTASFDYWVLSLSWSPQHCSGHGADPSEPQCDGVRRYGFVVHGLWPQRERGYSESCATNAKLDDQTAASMLDIMPSNKLVRHEWEKH